MRFLLVNDDGIQAAGLTAMRRELEKLGEVFVVAPSTEQSGVSASITFLTPLAVKNLEAGRVWTVKGSPVDCVKLAFDQLCADQQPDIVVSGINHGLNTGRNVSYSGTIAGAMEGARCGALSFAVSLEFKGDEVDRYDVAAKFCLKAIKGVLARKELLKDTRVYNVNVPRSLTEKAVEQIAALGSDLSDGGEGMDAVIDELFDCRSAPVHLDPLAGDMLYSEHRDPYDKPYYWLRLAPMAIRKGTDSSGQLTDCELIRRGIISVTPLVVNPTDEGLLAKLKASGDFECET